LTPKRLLLVLLIAGAGFGIYREVVVEAPVRAFHEFARLWALEDTPAAAALTTGDVARGAVETKILRGVVRAPMEALRGSRQEVENREPASDGDVEVTVKQFVFYDPPGITSGVGGAGVAIIRHVARMRKTPEGWRVASWTPAFLDAHSRRDDR
jgi:hypothetical protein